jgi:methionine biosynthesis protein metW
MTDSEMNDIRDSYDKICEQWCDFRKNTKINRCVAEFSELLRPGSKVLDAGCGTGYPISAYLVEKGFAVTGIDISERMIEKARRLGLKSASFLVRDLLDFHPPEKYDAVIAFDSLWHVSHDRQKEIYAVVSSLMNIGGYFLFTHGDKDGSIVGEMFGERFYHSALDVEEVHALLAACGFSVLSSVENYKEETTGDRGLLVIAKKTV